MPAATGEKVLLVGWDAADWRVIRPLLSRGQMPALSRLLSRGTAATLIAPSPLLSPTLWSTLATGRSATGHRVLSSLQLAPDRSRLVPVDRLACHAKPVWEMLARAGIRCHTINFPATHPAQPTGGISISNRFPEPESVWPRERHAELTALQLSRNDIDPAALLKFVPCADEVDRHTDGRLDAIAEVLAQTATVHNLATWAMENVPWRFTAVCYTGIHQLSHLFMPFHPPRRDCVAARDFEIYQHVVTAAYRFHDMMLGRLLNLSGVNAQVILVSDHGFQSDHLRPLAAATTDDELLVWHRPQGVVVATVPGISSHLDVAPAILTLFGVKRDDTDGQVDASYDPPPAADISHLLELGYVESPDPYADAAEKRLKDLHQFHLAEALLGDGRPAEAIEILVTLAGRHDDVIEYRVALAHAYAVARRPDDCRRVVDSLRRDYPESAEALAAIGMLELESRRASNAVEHLRRAEEMGLRRPELYADLGRAYLRLRIFDDAARAFQRATKLDEELARAWIGLSAAELGRGETEAAIDAARRGIALEPANAEAHYRLGRALSAAGRDTEARRAFESAVAVDADFTAALRKLSDLAERTGDLKSAREYDRRAHLATVRKRWGGGLAIASGKAR